MRKLSSVAFAIALATSGIQSALAECSLFSCNAVTVSQLQMTSIGGVYVATSGNEQLASCAPNAGVFLHMPLKTVDDKPTNFKEMYATLLAAQLSGRVVSIELDPSNTAACTISYVTIADQ